VLLQSTKQKRKLNGVMFGSREVVVITFVFKPKQSSVQEKIQAKLKPYASILIMFNVQQGLKKNGF